MLACIGRAFIEYMRAYSSRCSAVACTGCFITTYGTFSEHGSVVSEPM